MCDKDCVCVTKLCDKVVCERFCVTKLRATKLSLCVCGRLCVEDCVCV